MSGAVVAAVAGVSLASVLIADMGLAGTYTSTDSGATVQQASLTLTVNTDGTWTITRGTGDAGTGTPLSGNWANGAPLSGLGNDYEVLFTVNSTDGFATITNGAVSYTSLSAGRAIQVLVNATIVNEVVSDNTNITVTVRKVGTTTPVSTDTFLFSVQAERI